MGGRTAAAGFRLFPAIQVGIQVEIPGFGDLKTAGCHIVVCLGFLYHGLQLFFHGAGSKESGSQTNHQSYNHIPNRLEGFFRKIVGIKGVSCLCLGKELLT